MKTKSVSKRRNFVGWMKVLKRLYSRNTKLQKRALRKITTWKGRFGRDTPVALESTVNLLRCQQLDKTGQLEARDVVRLYGMALVRFVDLNTEQKRKIPLRKLARKVNIPGWMVTMRHDCTHRRLPSLKWCRKGCQFALDWLHQYWSRQMGNQLKVWKPRVAYK